MYKQRLKIKARYGKSSHPKAWRPHLIDHERSAVRVYPGQPQLTFYEVKFYCGTISPRQHVVTLNKLAEGTEVCKACLRYKKLRNLYGNNRLPRMVYVMEWAENKDQASEAPF
jgi:hypothetical protein